MVVNTVHASSAVVLNVVVYSLVTVLGFDSVVEYNYSCTLEAPSEDHQTMLVSVILLPKPIPRYVPVGTLAVKVTSCAETSYPIWSEAPSGTPKLHWEANPMALGRGESTATRFLNILIL